MGEASKLSDRCHASVLCGSAAICYNETGAPRKKLFYRGAGGKDGSGTHSKRSGGDPKQLLMLSETGAPFVRRRIRRKHRFDACRAISPGRPLCLVNNDYVCPGAIPTAPDCVEFLSDFHTLLN